MSYVALYRKFRPGTFEQVKGQDHIVRTLKNQIRNNRVGHAYLFTGTRGTGKTSVAKILAKAVNCLDPQDGEPCCRCENCIAASHGSFIDIVEIDAASNTGVEDIRRVIEEIQYTPARGRYKVYIIDEVHMLSMNAFNAFLKTLEEPPEYVVFILATTEPHKLPATILSRCQRYDFKRISLDVIADNMKDLLRQEQIEAEEKAIRYVARAGDGSMRDALSLLDRCVAFSLGEKITYESVLSVLGTVDTEDFSALYRAIHGFDVPAALKIIEKTVESGRDLTPFISDFVMYLRNLLVLSVGGQSASLLLGLSEDNIKLLKEDAKDADPESLMGNIRILSELLNQLRFSPAKQILTEITIIRLARPQMGTDLDSVLERIRQLENRPVQASPQTVRQAPREVPKEPDIIDMGEDEFVYADFSAADMPAYNEPEYEPLPEPEAFPPVYEQPAEERSAGTAVPVSAGGQASKVKNEWQQILSSCGDRRLRAFLNKAEVEAEEENAVTIYAGSDIAYKQLKEDSALEYVKQLITDISGCSVNVFVKHAASRPEIPDQQDFSSLFKNINMNIETEEN